MKKLTNTKTQKEIAEAVAEFRKRFVEIWSPAGGWTGTKVKVGGGFMRAEKEAQDFLTQKLEHLAKQKDEEFMGMLEELKPDWSEINFDEDNFAAGKYDVVCRIKEQISARAELRNKLQGGKE